MKILGNTKKIIFTAALLLTTLALSAQGELINKYLDKYAEDESLVKVSINSRMFSLFTEMEGGTEEEKEFLEAVAKLKGLKVLASDSLGKGQSRSLFNQATKDVDGAGYEELMTVKDAEEDVKFSIKEKSGIIEELIMVVGGNKNFVFLSLYGEIDLKTVSKLASTMRVDGLKSLEKLDEGN
ncbi:MAG: DUF4252 domain-containing protein [Bacteroidota bacterium]